MDRLKKEVLAFSVLAFVLLIVSGAEQCSQTGISGISGIGGKTEAAKFGVDFALEQGIDKLSEGKTINQGDTFFVDIALENYDSQAKTGEICIRDDIDSAYGGIPNICKQFNLPAATYFNGVIQSPATLNLAFPESNDYFSYAGLPADINAKLYASLSYIQHSSVSGAISAPSPETESSITLQQPLSPLQLSLEKTISSRTDNVKANLKITFSKQEGYNITTTDFRREGLIFTPTLGNYNLDCTGLTQGFVDLKSTNFISCSAFLPREQITHPILMNLDYGVKVNREIGFTIKKA